MNIREAIIEEYPDEEFVFAEGFDEAVLGVVRQYSNAPVVCYDYEKCIEILGRDMPEEDAIEYFEYNVIGGWIGDKTPYFLFRLTEMQSLPSVTKKKVQKKVQTKTKKKK